MVFDPREVKTIADHGPIFYYDGFQEQVRMLLEMIERYLEEEKL